jgi:hypothetical protein
MLSNRLAFVALAIACVGAAAGGGYLATRQNTVPTPAAAQVETTGTASASRAGLAASDTVAAGAAPMSSKPAEAPQTSVDAAPQNPAARSSKVTGSKQAEQPPAREVGPRASRPAPPTAHRDPAPIVATDNTQANATAVSAPHPIDAAPSAPRPEDHVAPEPTRPTEPPARAFAEYVVSADSVIGLQTETRVTSETARVEDRVEARVTRDVRVGDHVAIPAGARAIGSVMQVDRGGKFKERAHLGIRFHTLVLADGTRIPISTETIFREGDPPGNSSPSKVGGAAVGGAILGAILGGSKGMAIGAAAGAGAGTAGVAAGDRNAATLPAGTAMTVRILQPITVSVERE